MKKKIVLVPLLLIIGMACSTSDKPPKPPENGVVLFRSYDDPFFCGEMASTTVTNWKKLGVKPALLHFVSTPGLYVTTDFNLITPKGEKIQPEYFKTTWGIGRWEPVVTTHGTELVFNPVSINKMGAKFEIYLIFLIKGNLSPEFKLNFSDENKIVKTFPISPAAFIVDEAQPK